MRKAIISNLALALLLAFVTLIAMVGFGQAYGQRYGQAAVLNSDFTPCWGAPHGQTDPPSRSRVLIAHSRDGMSFQRPGNPNLALVVDRAGVPDAVVLRSGRILLYFVAGCKYHDDRENKVDEIAVGVSDNNGSSWVFKNVQFTGIPWDLTRPVDPNVVLMPNGDLILFGTMWVGRRQHQPPLRKGRIYSFLSRDGGFTYAFQGLRYDPPGGPPDGVFDPENYRFSDTNWQIHSGGPVGYGLSTDGGKTFTSLGQFSPTYVLHDVTVTGEPGVYRAYTPSPGGVAIRSFRSDAEPWRKWRLDPGDRLTLDPTSGVESCEVVFPTVVKLAKHEYLMMYQTVIPGCSCTVTGVPSCP
jgi:hypothetical protein